MKIALFNPNKQLYSETFIEAHKLYLKDDVCFYYGNVPTIHLEGEKMLKKGFLYWLQVLYCKIKGYSSSDYIMYKSILKSLKKHKVDVILVEYGPHAHKLLPVLKATNLPVVVHFHGYDAGRTNIIEKYNSYSNVFKHVDKVIAVSKVMYKKLLNMGCPEHKLEYNVYGPREEFQNIQSDFSKKTFLSVGRFTDKKAPYYTILAFKEVVKKHSDVMLIMAGDGPLLNTCINLVSHLGINKNVNFIGVISQEEFRDLLKVSTAYVQHSIIALDGDMEGTPLSVLESSMAGLPVIATNHAGIPDVIIHNETGLLFEEHDVVTMSEHMLYVLDNKKEAERLGMAGKKYISKHYNISRHIEKLQNILNDITIHNK